MKCIALWKESLKTYRKGENSFIYCILFIGQLFSTFKIDPFKFMVADTECSNTGLNCDAAKALRNSQLDQILLLLVFELTAELQSHCHVRRGWVIPYYHNCALLRATSTLFLLQEGDQDVFHRTAITECWKWVPGTLSALLFSSKNTYASKYGLVHNNATPYNPNTLAFAASSQHLWLFVV